MAVAEVTKTTSNIEGGGEAAPSFIERVKEYIESLKKEMRLVIVDMAIGQAVTKVFQVLSR